MSLPKGFASVQKELRRLGDEGWYEFYPALPFWPFYANAQGAMPRKLDQRWRRTTEGGGPRRTTFDSAGVRVWSLNDASKTYHMPQHFADDTRPEMLRYLHSRQLPPTEDQLTQLAFNRHSKWPRQRMPDVSHVMRDLAVLKHAAHLLGEPVSSLPLRRQHQRLLQSV